MLLFNLRVGLVLVESLGKVIGQLVRFWALGGMQGWVFEFDVLDERAFWAVGFLAEGSWAFVPFLDLFCGPPIAFQPIFLLFLFLAFFLAFFPEIHATLP